MEYQKCDNYPRCTFVECECHQKALFDAHLSKPVISNKEKKEIESFKKSGNKIIPVYKTKPE
jgi:ssDNA-binding Zn-finger/Zn-ribbon topoisomerase 1